MAMKNAPTVAAVLAAAAFAWASGTAPADGAAATRPTPNTPRAVDAGHRGKAIGLIDGGIGYLLAHADQDGGWSLGRGANKPAITAMVLKALLQHRRYDADHPVVQKGFQILLGFRRKDGGIYDPRTGLANYTTSLAVMAMTTAGRARFQAPLDGAVKFLKSQQIVAGSESPDGQAITEEHPFMGGVSYGRHGRPDLSNVGMWIQALHDAGVKADDPALRNALVFITRTQQRSESNPLAWARKGDNDGGFVYAPAIAADLERPESKADPQYGLRSYGSMTYVGFKSMLYAGLGKDDPRVRAAYQWIRRYWRLDSNPNMPRLRSKQGLYYYYHVFAKALRAWGRPVITDAKGRKHNWRHELIDALGGAVGKDGSWVNAGASRWAEGNPILVTTYSVLALQEAMKADVKAAQPAHAGP